MPVSALHPANAGHGHLGDVESDEVLCLSAMCLQRMATPCHLLDVCRGNLLCCAQYQGLVTAEVQKKSGEVGCVLCVGHNKGMEEAASSLAVRLSSCMNIPVCTAQSCICVGAEFGAPC